MAIPRQSQAERASLAEQINQLPWHHQIDFGDGLLSKGNTPIDHLREIAEIYFRDIVSGRSVLDIGCWDGFNSFEAYRRGATRVLAADHFAWSEKCWGDRRSFDLAHRHLAPAVEVMDIDLPDMTPERVGRFDIVLFAGIFYHLRNPFLALEQIARLSREWIIVETHMDAENENRPAMIFYPTNELANDPTNWWGPNRACVEAMLRDVGVPHIEFIPNPFHRNRGIFRARRS
jgi:tRNA (mo5U34)-methyltransferase